LKAGLDLDCGGDHSCIDDRKYIRVVRKVYSENSHGLLRTTLSDGKWMEVGNGRNGKGIRNKHGQVRATWPDCGINFSYQD
jgi:hypothetical protein